MWPKVFFLCRAVPCRAVPRLRRLVTGPSQRGKGLRTGNSELAPGSLHVGFVALGQVFLRGLQYSPVSIIPP
jgi:hypothetical protein